MTKSKLEIIIADCAEREHLFAEAWLDEECFGEIFINEGKPIVTIFNHSKQAKWTLDNETLKAIVLAFDDFLNSIDYH